MTSDYLKRLDVQGYLRVQEALRKWDPIGVCPGSGAPADEYDSYAAPIVRMLDGGASKEEIMKYLKSICVERMEIGFDRTHSEEIVGELLAFWPLWKKQLAELGSGHIIEE
jgi:hypothetical protein